MSFNNLSASGSEAKKIPLVFVRPLFSDIEADAVAGKKIPTTGGWVQIKTADGGVKFTPKRTTSTTYNQQDGDVDLYQDDCKYDLELNVSQLTLDILQDLLIMDPASSSPDTALDFKANRGAKLTTKGISVLVYDKNQDPNNSSNAPDVDCDSEALVILKAAPASDSPAITWDGNQNVAKLMFNCLASKSAGAAAGIVAKKGAFTAL